MKESCAIFAINNGKLLDPVMLKSDLRQPSPKEKAAILV